MLFPSDLPTVVFPSIPMCRLHNQYCIYPSLHMGATCPTHSVLLYLVSLDSPCGCATTTASTNETNSAVSVFKQNGNMNVLRHLNASQKA